MLENIFSSDGERNAELLRVVEGRKGGGGIKGKMPQEKRTKGRERDADRWY